MALPFKIYYNETSLALLQNICITFIIMYYFLGSNKKIFTNRSFVNFCHWHAVRR